MRSPAAALLGVCLLFTGVLVPSSARAEQPIPTIHPTPTKVTTDKAKKIDLRGRVTVVAPTAQADAVRVLREQLATTRSQVTVTTPDAALPAAGTVIVLGTTEDNPEVSRLVKAAGLSDSPSLAKDEGYVVHPGTDGRRKAVLLAGHDQRGVFYATQTLRQLITGTSVAAATVEDAPLMSIRGVVEGFYGFPWSHQARLDQLAFYGEHKMNTYIYTPKDDELLRKKWREPYTGEHLADLQELIDTAKANQVDFVFALSPGNDLCYSSEADLAATKAKFESLYELGVRDFYIALDDIPKELHCQSDKDKFPGETTVAQANAQAHYLNLVNDQFVHAHDDVNPLHMVPTSYTGSGPTDYKTALGKAMASDIRMQWTGEKVVSHEITLESATKARTSYGTADDPREISVWDNYPVNDFAQDRLFLGSVRKRDPQLHTQLLGFTSNPMIEPYASLPTIANYADYSWNPPAYDAEESMATALAEIAGPDKAVQGALTIFADLNNNWQDDPDYPNAPELSADAAAFWKALDAGTTTPVALDDRLKAIEALPTSLEPMANQGFRSDAEDWIVAASQWGAASRHAVAMVRAVESGDLSGAVEHRAGVIKNRQLALRATHETLTKGTLTPKVGDGAFQALVNEAMSRTDEALGLSDSGPRPTATTTMGTYKTYEIGRAVDGDDSTYFWSSHAPKVADEVRLDYGEVIRVGRVTLRQAQADDTAGDMISNGVLEASADGTTWTEIGSVNKKPLVEITPDEPIEARYVRVRVTAVNKPLTWVQVREFGVSVLPPGISSTIESASGTLPESIADGELDTRWAAASAAGADDHLQWEFEEPRDLSQVTIVGDVAGTLQVRRGGEWIDAGAVDDRFAARVAVTGGPVDAVRIVFTEGTVPDVAEVITT